MPVRDDKGRFIKGNGGGPGRPKKEREERYYELLITAVSFEDWKRIVEKARDQALRGDAISRKWLADYLAGAPVQKHEINARLNMTIDWDNDASDD